MWMRASRIHDSLKHFLIRRDDAETAVWFPNGSTGLIERNQHVDANDCCFLWLSLVRLVCACRSRTSRFNCGIALSSNLGISLSSYTNLPLFTWSQYVGIRPFAKCCSHIRSFIRNGRRLNNLNLHSSKMFFLCKRNMGNASVAKHYLPCPHFWWHEHHSLLYFMGFSILIRYNILIPLNVKLLNNQIRTSQVVYTFRLFAQSWIKKLQIKCPNLAGSLRTEKVSISKKPKKGMSENIRWRCRTLPNITCANGLLTRNNAPCLWK